MLKIGIPGSLYSYTYEPFIRSLAGEMGFEACFDRQSSKSVLDRGAGCCVDEVCMPMKIFAGHVMRLSEKCDLLPLPRIMQTERGKSICPKFCGLPEIIGYSDGESAGNEKGSVRVTRPLYLKDRGDTLKTLLAIFGPYIESAETFERAFYNALRLQRETVRGIEESGYKYRVFLAGHPYNIYDEYVNLRLLQKLHGLDIGVITQERVDRREKESALRGFVKKPYWETLADVYGAGVYLTEHRRVDGVIYLSSFSCGIDSVTAELLKNRIAGMNVPFLLLKLDEQTGEAGYDTRLEAFESVLRAGRERGICR